MMQVDNTYNFFNFFINIFFSYKIFSLLFFGFID